MCEGRCCLSLVSVCVAISTYILLGATAFFFLENQHSKQHSLPNQLLNHADLDSLRNSTIQRLWVLTLELNVFYESNWTSLAELELQKFQDEILKFLFTAAGGGGGGGPASSSPDKEENLLHNFPAALLYCLTLITTIGYGSVSPKSMSGRILTVLYASVGIPLTLCYLATVGDTLARFLRTAYSRTVKRASGVPIPLSLILLLGYLGGGAAVFWWLEGWSFIDALFFCFASLATIGFGGMLDPHSKHISLLISSVYILVGMALISTVFNLVQDEVVRRRAERGGRYHRPIS